MIRFEFVERNDLSWNLNYKMVDGKVFLSLFKSTSALMAAIQIVSVNLKGCC